MKQTTRLNNFSTHWILILFIIFSLFSASGVFATSTFIQWSTISSGSGCGITATVSSTVTTGKLFFDNSLMATDLTFTSQFDSVYSGLTYNADGQIPANIDSVISFASPLPHGSRLIALDIDFDNETLTLTNNGSPLSLLGQIESFSGETSIFPNYNPATGDLITAGSTPGGLNNREASIFDVSGLSSVQVSFMNGSYGSGIIVAIALPVPCGDICPCPGDLDGDQDVDGWDLADFSYYFNQQLSGADLNADNIFDITDIEIFTADYGRNDCPPSCDDDNACTIDSCDPVTGCRHDNICH